MEESDFSQRERMILAEIEEDLRCGDALLDRRMSRMRRGVRPWAAPWQAVRHHRLGTTALLLAGASLALFVLAVSVPRPALIWAFALAWALTLTCVLRLVIGWCRRWSGVLARRERPGT
ncbi:DUF3040 domain-containing protein [Streptomyces sp. NPDC089919]|uniref:DUF3040 domain-containing protein n=1 Tax=Streptomyces sp. NPDC089919 TaxID=3155188 RepID=UPI003421EF54